MGAVYSPAVRRFTPLVAVVLAVAIGACSSSKPSSSSSTSSGSAGASTTTSTLPPDAKSSLDAQGARAYAALIAANLQRDEPDKVTVAQVECLPDALVNALGGTHMLEIAQTPFGEWTLHDRDAAVGAFRGCGFGDDVLKRIGLLS
jgi:hypothetical protein